MSAYHITRATLAPDARNLGALLADSSDLDAGHRLIWTLFPGDDAERDFVYRAADNRTFLIVSARPAADPHKLWRLEAKPYAPEPVAGQRYSFILRANPAIDISRAGRRSERVDAVMHAKWQAKASGVPWTAYLERQAALDWLFAREASLGVRFARDACDAAGYTQAAIPPKGDAKDRRRIRHATVDFEGFLEVADSARLAEKLTHGIGRARAFGCGLMLIRRA